MSKVIEALLPVCASYLIVPGVCKVSSTFKICLRVSKMTASWGGTWSYKQKLDITELCFPYNLCKYDRATAANMLLMETVCRAQACCLLHCRTASHLATLPPPLPKGHT